VIWLTLIAAIAILVVLFRKWQFLFPLAVFSIAMKLIGVVPVLVVLGLFFAVFAYDDHKERQKHKEFMRKFI